MEKLDGISSFTLLPNDRFRLVLDDFIVYIYSFDPGIVKVECDSDNIYLTLKKSTYGSD